MTKLFLKLETRATVNDDHRSFGLVSLTEQEIVLKQNLSGSLGDVKK